MEKYSRKSFKYIFGMNSIYLGNNYLWISFESLFLPFLIARMVAQNAQSLYLGIIAFAGIIIGISFNVFAGITTDSLETRFGRRRPFIMLGSAITLGSLIYFIIYHSSIISILIVYVLIEIGSNMAYGSYLPLVRDIIPDYQRGTSSGISGFFTLIGTALGFGISGLLLGYNKLNLALMAIILSLFITTLFTVNTIRNEDYRSNADKIFFHFSKLFKKIANQQKFKWMSISNFFIIIGSSGLTFFEFYYFEYILNIKNSAIYVAIAGLIILTVSAISAVLIGMISDKIGKDVFIFILPVIGGISVLMIIFVRSFYLFLIIGSVLGITFGNYFSMSNSYISYVVPRGSAGRFMSLFSFSTGIGEAFSPMVYGFILFIFGGQKLIAYIRLFEISSLFYFIGAIIIFFKVVNLKPELIKNN
ncbi:MFS transporter [Acidiplasma sp.]|uniref:MFS transporter n=1 Tax=Acidiplasma sp. TaxID=1872114 RepID=UPI0025847EB7|nr:MFS transporter [Acidiplasma sp.]